MLTTVIAIFSPKNIFLSQAKELSAQWARGEISGSAMKSALIAKHKLQTTGTPHE
jgi:hypothetical protein